MPALREWMMSENGKTDSQRIAFGHQIRRLRREKGWTLAQVAERSGLAVSTISKAERGVIALTYDRLSQLAHGLETDMAAFFAAGGSRFEPGGFAVARKGEFSRQETRNYVYEMLFPEVWDKAMTPMMGTLKAHDIKDFEEFVRHSGQEFLLVLVVIGRHFRLRHLDRRFEVCLGQSVVTEATRLALQLGKPLAFARQGEVAGDHFSFFSVELRCWVEKNIFFQEKGINLSSRINLPPFGNFWDYV